MLHLLLLLLLLRMLLLLDMAPPAGPGDFPSKPWWLMSQKLDDGA